jgi:hypothetical protein
MKLFTSIAFLLLCNSLIAQTSDDKKVYDDINATYYLNDGRDGLAESAFKLKATVHIIRGTSKAQIRFNVRAEQSTVMNADPSFKCDYIFEGKHYGDQHVGKEVFNGIKATGLKYEVMIKYDSQSWTRDVDGFSNDFGDVPVDAKASQVAIWVKVIYALNFTGTGNIKRAIIALSAQRNAGAGPAERTASNSGTGASQPAIMVQRGDPVTSRSQTSTSRQTTETSTAALTDDVTEKSEKPAANYYADKPWLIDPSKISSTPTAPVDQRTSQVIDLVGKLISGSGKKMMTREDLDRQTEIDDAATAAAMRKYEEEQAKIKAKAAAAERMEAARLAREATISSRKAVIAPFSEGDIPRTLAGDVKQVYFFFAGYQPSALADRSFDLYVSNVFAVKPYGDGTWPFTEQLLSDLKKIKPDYTIALAGEFRTMESAEEKLAELKRSAANSRMTLYDVKYAGKNIKSDGQTDFWGTPVDAKSKVITTQTKEQSQSEVDYWGVPVKTTPASKPKAATIKSKTIVTEKKAEVDYWGNPVKP